MLRSEILINLVQEISFIQALKNPLNNKQIEEKLELIKRIAKEQNYPSLLTATNIIINLSDNISSIIDCAPDLIEAFKKDLFIV